MRIEAPLPGFSEDEIKVTLEKGRLSIRAEDEDAGTDQQAAEDHTYFLRERFRRVVARSVLMATPMIPIPSRGRFRAVC